MLELLLLLGGGVELELLDELELEELLDEELLEDEDEELLDELEQPPEPPPPGPPPPHGRQRPNPDGTPAVWLGALLPLGADMTPS